MVRTHAAAADRVVAVPRDEEDAGRRVEVARRRRVGVGTAVARREVVHQLADEDRPDRGVDLVLGETQAQNPVPIIVRH